MNKTSLAFISFLVGGMGLAFVGIQKTTGLPESIEITGWVIVSIGVVGMIFFSTRNVN